MNKSLVFKLLRCPGCSKADFREAETGYITCQGCGRSYPYHDGKFFFTELPKDARRLGRPRINPEEWGTFRKHIFSYFKDELSSEDTRKILVDLGTGTSPFRAITSPFNNFLGIDFFPYELVDVVADITKPLPIGDRSCDILLCSEVIEHIPNPELLIGEMARILKPGGYCLGSVPFLWPVHYAPYDFYRYTNFALEHLFRGHGFTDIMIKGVGSPADLYLMLSNQFFTARLLETKFSERRAFQRFLKYAARLARKAYALIVFIFNPLFRAVPPDTSYTLGYVFKAHKPPSIHGPPANAVPPAELVFKLNHRSAER